jgi:malto-oligosyltrehalose synthase/4-alpha-glucanotransferase
MYHPLSTYRLQLHKDFTLRDLEKALPYLHELGVHTIYVSPVFEAVPGSTHGYDGLNPSRINPEIGTSEDLYRCSAAVKEYGMYWLQDIVPNHMAFDTKNDWLMDVLRNGKQSPYAQFFDIGWDSEVHDGKIMVPFLGFTAEEAIDKGELTAGYKNGEPVLQYYDSHYPLSSDSVQFIRLVCGVDSIGTEQCLHRLNSNKNLLLEIVGQQHYHLCHWQETDRQINFRRFFTINGLICLNIQDKQVFTQYHKYIKRLVEEGVFNGLRIDHIDGLYEPSAYLDNLQRYIAPDLYTVVEKILQPSESIPRSWCTRGTTGYDFLAAVNNLFTDTQSKKPFTKFYDHISGDSTPLHAQVLSKKNHILYAHMGGELENLYQLLLKVNPKADQVDATVMKKAIGAFLIYCPVYRYYGTSIPLDDEEAEQVGEILHNIEQDNPAVRKGLDILRGTWLRDYKPGDEAFDKGAAHFYKRCMQFSGPLTAKGVEDTLMYTYARFIGHNDVGDTPETFGLSREDFHRFLLQRQKYWPHTLNTTSTHDTKRGEDVRTRLNVLTDIADEWLPTVYDWTKMNAPLKKGGMPDANDEYFIYQSLVGAYPMPDTGEDNFGERLEAYIEKLLREAKRHSNWATPDSEYEDATKSFARALLKKDTAFWNSFQHFHQRIADFGIVNSLAQTIIKFTSPGVPDVYQGTELWDLSLVDPDNRRPVDYTKRAALLSSFSADTHWQELWQRRYDGHIKCWLTGQLMQLRKQYPDVFSDGQYIPLKVEGTHHEHILAFATRHAKTWIVVAVPLHTASLCRMQDKQVETLNWGSTRILLPTYAPDRWETVLGKETGAAAGELMIGELFKTQPFALLKMIAPANERGAGVLLSITSLPSRHGIGDMGTEASKFISFLSKSKQQYWQLLPLNPTEEGNGHSPYSSYSSMAGNPWIISLELLGGEGLLSEEEINNYALPTSNKADYTSAIKVKEKLLDIAYHRFMSRSSDKPDMAFLKFCEREQEWLDDVALYVVIKTHFVNEPWYRWDDAYKQRDEGTLSRFATTHAGKINKYKWLQFIFDRQWTALRKEAAIKGIQLFGDMPFYVSYDSADVWANPQLFCLDNENRMTGIAGVPPDYFSEDGQLWGMPTYNWNVLKEQNYVWWIKRLKRNLELFDLLRIDHFRAFQEYWEVPAREDTAKNGRWLPGPRDEFFNAVAKAMGRLPFVAEDLGDKMDEVYELRKRLNLPGMKVLQFAWGENMPTSVDVPHHHEVNSIVYTGTHDNNTTVGWYKEETNKADHARMHQYLGVTARQKNIHEILSRAAYASVARIAILPVQDILGLDETARMNTPGKGNDNWLWRLQPRQLTKDISDKLRTWAELFDRA